MGPRTCGTAYVCVCVCVMFICIYVYVSNIIKIYTKEKQKIYFTFSIIWKNIYFWKKQLFGLIKTIFPLRKLNLEEHSIRRPQKLFFEVISRIKLRKWGYARSLDLNKYLQTFVEPCAENKHCFYSFFNFKTIGKEITC